MCDACGIDCERAADLCSAAPLPCMQGDREAALTRNLKSGTERQRVWKSCLSSSKVESDDAKVARCNCCGSKVAIHFGAMGAKCRDDQADRHAGACCRACRTARYGGADGKTEYFYAWTLDGVGVMHPFKPEWAGKNMMDKIVDGQKRKTLQDMADNLRKSGNGRA